MSQTEENTYSAAGEVGQIRMRRTWRQRAWIELKKAPLIADEIVPDTANDTAAAIADEEEEARRDARSIAAGVAVQAQFVGIVVNPAQRRVLKLTQARRTVAAGQLAGFRNRGDVHVAVDDEGDVGHDELRRDADLGHRHEDRPVVAVAASVGIGHDDGGA